eukprot:GAHX01000165.1.p1 GENE.GAHX01000165.1~~GAHX01000165.1.p1  ORF type:complete len:185 (-),score=31.31 GAHX01000165.1:47-601(-)
MSDNISHIIIQDNCEGSILKKDELYNLITKTADLFQSVPWKLRYKKSIHGASLETIFDRATSENGNITVIKTKTGEIIGVFSPVNWKRSKLWKFYGTGETFLFKIDNDSSIAFFEWNLTAKNKSCVLAYNYEGLFVGGLDNPALKINSCVNEGSSYDNEIFGNGKLAKNENFEIEDLEIWSNIY